MASHLVRSTGAFAVLVLAFTLPASCVIGPENAAGPCAEMGCDDANACTDDVCADDGFCDHVPAAAAPDDGNECTVDECIDNTERHTSRDDGDPCGLDGMLACEGGQCACKADGECGVSTICKTFRCESAACTSEDAAEGTFVDGAGALDCKRNECDGEGETREVPDLTDFMPDTVVGNCAKNACDDTGPVVLADPADAPPDDSNQCTTEACDGTTPILSEPLPDGTECGAPPTCVENAANTFETLPQQTCVAGSCTVGVPMPCGLFVCNAAGDGCASTCGGDGECVSVAHCVGTTCTADLGNGSPCSGDSQCTSGHCVDGLCCNEACNGTCEACDIAGQPGQCQDIAVNTDPDNECPGTQVCDGSGDCAKVQGETCGGDGECLSGDCEDGVCCNDDCQGSCRRCDLSGSVGVCSNVAAGQQAGQCAGVATCDGAGSCKLPIGSQCFDDDMCHSGFCAPEDGNDTRYCCNEACSGLCRSCTGNKTGGSNGTCGNILDKTDPDDECSPNGCNGGNGSGCCKNNGTCY